MNQASTHILLADDDDDDFLIFSSVVNEISYQIILTRAENGEILIKLLEEEENPDILFLDILMPCKDGRQCIKEIRANKKFDTLPVIVYSSLKTFNEVEFFYREGANLFVVKPNNFIELKAVLEKILSIDWKKVLYYPPLSQFVLKRN